VLKGLWIFLHVILLNKCAKNYLPICVLLIKTKFAHLYLNHRFWIESFRS